MVKKKTETEVKQVVEKRRKKQRYLYALPGPCPVESHGRVDGLYTLRSSQVEGFTRQLLSKLSFFIPI